MKTTVKKTSAAKTAAKKEIQATAKAKATSVKKAVVKVKKVSTYKVNVSEAHAANKVFYSTCSGVRTFLLNGEGTTNAVKDYLRESKSDESKFNYLKSCRRYKNPKTGEVSSKYNAYFMLQHINKVLSK